MENYITHYIIPVLVVMIILLIIERKVKGVSLFLYQLAISWDLLVRMVQEKPRQFV